MVAIAQRAFRDCKDLKRVVFSEDSRLEKIGSQCFYGTGLEEVKTPCGLKQIGSGVFENCKDLQLVELNEELVQLGGEEANYTPPDAGLFGVWEGPLPSGVFQGSIVNEMRVPSAQI